MNRNRFILVVVLFLICSFPLVFAKAGKSTKFRHADRNKDGVVDKKEMRMEHKWERRHRIKNKAKVNNRIEAKYDKNGDGWLQPAEAKKMLKDKHKLIRTKGKAKVDTAVEAEYDTNKDGILDAAEAETMFEDIR